MEERLQPLLKLVQGRPLEKIFKALQLQEDRRGNLADATIVRAHQDAAGAKGGLQSIAWVVHVVDSRRRSMRFPTPKAARYTSN